MSRPAPAGAADRALAWLATGPLGRVVAFAWDLSAAWASWAIRRARRRARTH